MKLLDFQILELTKLETMKKADLQKIYNVGAKYANERIQKFTEKGITPPSFYSLPAKAKRGYKQYKSLTKQQIIDYIQSQKHFLRSKTSTIRGYQSFVKEVQERTKSKASKMGYDEIGQVITLKPGQKSFYTERQVRKYWDLFHKMQQKDPNFVKNNSQRTRDKIRDLIKENPRASEETLERNLDEWYEKEYRKQIDEDNATLADIRSGFSE